nr:SDR family NAD(P)-dependent oxidoreductase [Anaerofilum hominis]
MRVEHSADCGAEQSSTFSFSSIQKEIYVKKIAIVTGASGGIGQEFVQELIKEALDEIWVIGRNKQRLFALKDEFGEKIIPVCKDLTDRADLLSISDLLKGRDLTVKWLVNNAGTAKMAPSTDLSFLEIEQTIDLNCKAPITLMNICIPFMEKGSKILNISSASAFQPVPFINLYASTKAFERNYSRALNKELKSAGITVTAVCPSWVDTPMLTKELNGKSIRFPGIVTPEKVVKKALKDAKKGKDMSICSLYVKCQHINVKLLPQTLTMKIWLHSIKKYL